MDLAWYALLGLFFASYLVLAGYDYGVGLLLARGIGPAGRREALTALGPFFLGNEVWLVAAVGILFGAFPLLEGELLAGCYPAVARRPGRRHPGHRRRAAAQPAQRRADPRPLGPRRDRSAARSPRWAGAPCSPRCCRAYRCSADGHVAGVTHLATPFAAAAGLAMVALVAVHGATFLALRLPAAEAAAGSAVLARRLVPVALTAVAVATVVGLLSARVRDAVQRPAVAVLLPVLLVAALLAARAALARRRPGLAFVATGAALALPVVLVGAALWPYVLVSTTDPGASLTVADAAASTPTLRLLGWVALPLLPALLGFQAMCWWVFRGRTDGRAPVYW